MEKHEAYDAILDLILEKGNATAKNVVYFLPVFADIDPARISLMFEDMYRLAPKAFYKKELHNLPFLGKTAYTHLLKEEGGFRPYLESRETNQPRQVVVFQKADGKSPLADLHPTVQAVASVLFENGHFRQALLDTYIALSNAVQGKAQLGLDNTPLMRKAFSPNNTVLKLSDDAGEQEGFMHLFEGAMMGIRNPLAHRLGEHVDPQRTLEWLSFASVLFRILDDSTVV